MNSQISFESLIKSKKIFAKILTQLSSSDICALSECNSNISNKVNNTLLTMMLRGYFFELSEKYNLDKCEYPEYNNHRVNGKITNKMLSFLKKSNNLLNASDYVIWMNVVIEEDGCEINHMTFIIGDFDKYKCIHKIFTEKYDDHLCFVFVNDIDESNETRIMNNICKYVYECDTYWENCDFLKLIDKKICL